ncbi:hypothetical protein P7K49_028917, partial [Saguinus oedipus]
TTVLGIVVELYYSIELEVSETAENPVSSSAQLEEWYRGKLALEDGGLHSFQCLLCSHK